MNRIDILTSMLDLSGAGLEIGPSYNPLVSKASGARIETVDHAGQEALIEKYAGDSSVDISKIEPVDYVSDGRPISQVIHKRSYYDYIIASHVIEHTTNPLGFFQDCQLLLKDSGVLVLAVPDRRYCFDFFRPRTSAGDVLQAFVENRSRHTVGAMFDHLAYVARRGEHIAWHPLYEGQLAFIHSLHEARAYVDGHDPGGHYVDCHAWQFTPSSFRLILHDLRGAGFLDLREHQFHETLGFEFFISLSPQGFGCPIDRLTLAEMAEREATAMPHVVVESTPTLVTAPTTQDIATELGSRPQTSALRRPWLRKTIKKVRRALGS